jgi:hypothetical protein
MDLANKARPRKPARRTGSHLASAKTFGDRDADQGRFFDLKLTDLFRTLADCPKTHSVSIYDRCKVRYERY